MPTKRRPSKVHRANGPYFPTGLIGGEYCVKCKQEWPCHDWEHGKAPNQ